MPEESHAAAHTGQFVFGVEDIFFVIVKVQDEGVFSGSFCHCFFLSLDVDIWVSENSAVSEAACFCSKRGTGGFNVVNLSRKSANYKFTRMKKPFVIP